MLESEVIKLIKSSTSAAFKKAGELINGVKAEVAVLRAQVASMATQQATQASMSLSVIRAYNASVPVGAILLNNKVKAGLFVYDPDDLTTVDNGATTIVTAAGKRFKRVIDDGINVRWFGATGTGTVDESTHIQEAVDFAKFVATENGGNVRHQVKFPSGIYLIFEPINCTEANGLWLVGAGSYVNVHITGATGAQIFDFSGSILSGCSGFTFISELGWDEPSTIGVQFALTEDPVTGEQRGGLNCDIRDCFFQMQSMPTVNGGYGTIGVLNVRAEEFAMGNLLVKTDAGIMFSNMADLTRMGKPFIASSKFVTLARGSGSMGVVKCYGRMSIQNVTGNRPALSLLNVNSFFYDGYLVRSNLGPEHTAVKLYGQANNIHISGTIEGYSTVCEYSDLNHGVNFDIIIANQKAPMQPVFNVGRIGRFYDCHSTVSFGIPEEFNNGRYFVWAPDNAEGNEPYQGFMNNCYWNCSDWVDNNLFVKGNVLKMASNSHFNSGQPFERIGGAVVDRKTYKVPLGTYQAASSEVTGTLVRFSRFDRPRRQDNNGGLYMAKIRGVLILGGVQSSGGNCVVDFESTVMVSQNFNSNPNVPSTRIQIHNTSLTSYDFLNIVDIKTEMDISKPVGEIRLTATCVGSGLGESLHFLGQIELISDHYVNQSVMFQ